MVFDGFKENVSSNKCHRTIGPVGLALENYDALGGWRERYQETYQIRGQKGETVAADSRSDSELTLALPIDTAGELPDGVPLNEPKDITTQIKLISNPTLDVILFVDTLILSEQDTKGHIGKNLSQA